MGKQAVGGESLAQKWGADLVTFPTAFLPLCPGLQASELWEVVEEPRSRLGAEGIMPERQEGHLLKKRKWPLKGWHKVGWAGQREGPDAGAEGGVEEGVGSIGAVCVEGKKSPCVWLLSPHTLSSRPPGFSFLLGHVTEILRARGRDSSLCNHSARRESGPLLGVVG